MAQLSTRTYFLAASLARTTGWCPLVLLQQSQGEAGEHLQQLSSHSAPTRSQLLPPPCSHSPRDTSRLPPRHATS